METTSTVWKLVVFSVILSTGASDIDICPKHIFSMFPVVHMCTEDSVLNANSLFIDAFVSATTATTCTCTLQATSSVEITISVAIAPDVPCDSEIRIHTKHVMNYTCGYITTYEAQTVGPEGVSISLRTVVSNKDATYCLNIVKYLGDGTLSLKCFLPYNITSSTTTSTTTDTTQIGSTTPVMTNTPNSEHQQESGSFPDNNVCPKKYISKLPVVRMCTEDSVSNANTFFIDAFASATTATTCTCTLQATSSVEITTSMTIAPDVPCDSEIRIHTKHVMNFTCGYKTTYEPQTVGPEGVSISLRTVVSNKDATYCLNIAKYRGEGTLSLKCFLPYNITSSTPTSTTTDTTQIGTTIPVMTNNPNSEHQQQSASFPVAGAVAIGAVGVLLIEAVIVSIVVVYRRLSQRKPSQNNTGNDVAYVNGNVNTSSVDDKADSNYDQLQHTNHPSSVDQEHVYLHVTGQTSSVQNKPDTSEQAQYVNMKTKT